MTRAAPRWVRIVLIATTLVFVAVAVYVFAFRFAARLHADDAVMVLLAEKALHAGSPVVGDWYYANGDIWVFAPQLIALVPVAILGVGLESLRVALVIALILELVVLATSYRRLDGTWPFALLATMTTAVVWSRAHVDYCYVQGAYGFATGLYVLLFSLHATAIERSFRRRHVAWIVLLVALTSSQNPSRALAFVLLPLVVATAWPWRAITVRHRLTSAGVATAGWVLGYLCYALLLEPHVTWSVPRSYGAFALADVDRIRTNIELLGRGLVVLCGGDWSPMLALPGALLLCGALVLVGGDVLATRELTARRFASLAVFVQLGGVLGLMILATHLMENQESVRYLMPSLLMVLGLAVLVAGSALAGASRWRRRLAIAWLAALPVVALLAARGARVQRPVRGLRPNAAELVEVAAELERRDLRRGFAVNIAANVLTIDSGGFARACPVTFWNAIIPQRWLADPTCFTADRIPERFFVVADRVDTARQAIHKTLGDEAERFTVGSTYEVYVYRRADVSLAWLDLPIPDGERATFPMRIAATNLQLLRDKSEVKAEDLVATGEPGTVVYGPYIELPEGDYQATWFGTGIESPGQFGFVVSADGGRDVLTRTDLDAGRLPTAHGELVRLRFSLGRARRNIELLVSSRGGARVSLHEVVIERSPR